MTIIISSPSKIEAHCISWWYRRSYCSLHLAHLATLNLTHECHQFFTELSVLPGRRREISAHRFPSFSCMIEIIWSSSFVQLRLSTCGDSWLCHLSLHCFAFLDFSMRATLLQLLAPCVLTYLCSFASSSLVPAIRGWSKDSLVTWFLLLSI